MVTGGVVSTPGRWPACLAAVLMMTTTTSLVVCDVINVNEDGDTQWLQGKSQKPMAEIGLRLIDGPNGLPVPIDYLLTPFLSAPSDDQGQGQSAEAECFNGSELSELDMCLTPRQASMFDSVRVQGRRRRRRRQASANGFSLWKNGVIPYVFNTTFPPHDHEAILGAMAEWEKATCIRFRLATVEDTDVVVFRDGRRCSTNIGRIGREQAVTLAKTCRSKRILIHELGHVIGLIHEHQRHDRDKYVKVLLENVRNMSQERYQFSKLLTGSITDKAVKYDYTSVMHYGRNYFARSPELTTLQTTDGLYQDIIGRAERPSFSDMETVNRLYQCAAGCHQSIQCGETCYVDSTCLCKCPPGLEKTFLNVPYHNSLHDATCEFFASRGECTGNIKDTLRPLCAKSCGLHLLKLNNPLPEVWSQALGFTSNQLQSKSTGSAWGTSPSSQDSGASLGLNSDLNVVNDVMSADTILPALAMQRSIQARQSESGSSTRQSLLQDRPFLLVGNNQQISHVRLTTSIEVTHQQHQQHQQLQNANSHDVPQLQAAELQKQAVLGSTDPHTLRSLLLTRTPVGRDEQQLGLVGQVTGKTRQGNGYPQVHGTTGTPNKFSNPVIGDLLASVDSAQSRNLQLSEVSNWFTRSAAPQGLHQQQQTNFRGSLILQALQSQTGASMPGFNIAANHRSVNFQVEHGLSNGESGVQFINERGNNFRGGVNVENNFSPRDGTDAAQRNRDINNQGASNPQAAGVERGGGSPPLAEYTGPEFSPLAPTMNGMAHTETANGPGTSRNLQTIGPSFMKSGAAPQTFLLSEQSSPLGSPVELTSKDTLEPPMVEQYFPANLRTTPQQMFEPSFFLTGPNARHQQSRVSVWESPIMGDSPTMRHDGSPQANNGNTELFIDTPGPSGQPGAPIDQPPVAGRAGAHHHLSQPQSQTTSEGGGFQIQPGNPGADVYGNQQLWYQIHLQQQQQHNELQSRQVPLFHVLSRHLSFTDPTAETSVAATGREADNVSSSFPPTYRQSDNLASLILTSLTSSSEPQAGMAKHTLETTALPSLPITSPVEPTVERVNEIGVQPQAGNNSRSIWLDPGTNANILRDILTMFPELGLRNDGEKNASSHSAGVVYSFPRQKRRVERTESSQHYTHNKS